MAIGTAASTASAVRWLSPLNTVDSSLAVTQKARNAFYIVALIHGLLVASSSQFILLPDIVTYAFLAYLAARAMSRAIAIVLVVLSIMDLILFLDTAPPGFQETLRIVIMVIAAGTALRIAQGTIAYRRWAATHVDPRSLAVLAILVSMNIWGVWVILSGLALLGYRIDDPDSELLVRSLSIAAAIGITLLATGILRTPSRAPAR